jgi:uncharacterized protein (DUF885 family)
MIKKLFTYGLILCTFSSCTKSNLEEKSNPEFNTLLDKYYEDQLVLNPLSATFNGDNRFNDQLNIDFTDAHRAKTKDLLDRYENELKKFNRESLNANDQISYDILKRELDLGLEGLGFNDHYMPLNQFYGFHLTFAQLGSGSVMQPFQTVKDYENWESRMHKGAAYLDSAQVYFNRGIKENIVLPKALVVKMINQLNAFDVKELNKSTFYGPLNQFPKTFTASEKERFTKEYTAIISQEVLPAYKRLANYLSTTYLPKARTSSGIGAIPNGKAYYQYLIKVLTTTDKPADEIYQIGLSEVKRIRSEMEKTKDAVGFKGSLSEFFQFLKTDPQFMPYKTPKDVLDAFHQIHERMKPQLTKMFGKTPKTPFEIRQTEAFRAASASAEYFQGSLESNRPGIFYVPILDATKFATTSGMESLFLHEAIPGHHYQIAIQQENTHLPKFRRFGGNSAFAEGWALYTESLGKELGLYTDPYQYMGALGDEIHRAIRLVVDAGMHSKNMTREQAIQYMMDNEQISEEGATAEIERYMAIPAQALSYKIGALKIREIRQKLANEQKDKFSISNFHDKVLEDGNMPMDVLERKMLGK